jgi:ferric-dicitrate binding protein FerR (iron transport regulator)
MVLPGRPRRWFPRSLRADIEAGEVRFLTGPRFPGRTLVLSTPEGRAEITGTVVSVLRDVAMGATCVCVMEGTARIGMTDADMEPVPHGMRKVMFADGRTPLVVSILPEHRDGLTAFQKAFAFLPAKAPR